MINGFTLEYTGDNPPTISNVKVDHIQTNLISGHSLQIALWVNFDMSGKVKLKTTREDENGTVVPFEQEYPTTICGENRKQASAKFVSQMIGLRVAMTKNDIDNFQWTLADIDSLLQVQQLKIPNEIYLKI